MNKKQYIKMVNKKNVGFFKSSEENHVFQITEISTLTSHGLDFVCACCSVWEEWARRLARLEFGDSLAFSHLKDPSQQCMIMQNLIALL